MPPNSTARWLHTATSLARPASLGFLFIFPGCVAEPTEPIHSDDTAHNIEGLEGLPEDLVQTGGCADLIMFAVNSEDTLALFLYGSEIAAAAHSSGISPYVEVHNISDSSTLQVEVQVGTDVTVYACDDATKPGVQPIVETTYAAVQGTVALSLVTSGEPTPWGEYPATATATLADLILKDADGHTVRLDSFMFTESVGWLPG